MKVLFFKILAVCSKSVFCASSNLISIPIAAIYFYKPVYVAPNAPTTTCFTLMPHILAISLIFLNLSYFPLIHQYICKYGKIYDLNFLLGSINEKCIWSSSFSLGITVDCKIQQNFVPFVLNNYLAQGRTTVELLESHVFRIISSEYICIHCHASFYIPFGPRSYIHAQYVKQSLFLLYTFYIEVIHQSYLYETSHSSFSELVIEHYRLKLQCIILNNFSLATFVCWSCPYPLFI